MSKKSPQLRFEGFTDDWELRKLGDEVKINGRIGFRGYTQADIVTKETGVLAYSPTNIVNNRLYRKQSDTYITKQKYRESPEIMVKNSDILFVKTGSTLGKSALVQSINYHATVNPQIVIIRSNELDEYFLSVILTSYNILKRINTIKIGGAIPTMTETELKKFPIQVPKSTEQKKIGSFFKQLDNTIALHQRKLDLLKEQKKGYLQKMFPKNSEKVPELRFEGFADDWEDRKLGDTLTELKSGLSRMLSNNDIGLPVVRANNINDGQFNIDSDVKYWYVNDPQGANTVNYLIRKNDILINFINSEAKMGTATIVENTPIRDTIYTTNILRARLKKEYDSYYWFALTQINQYKINIKIITKPAVNQASFTTVDFKKLNFMFPNLKEQQKIGSFFKQLDNTIALHQRKLDLLKEQKKGFLQNMFV